MTSGDRRDPLVRRALGGLARLLTPGRIDPRPDDDLLRRYAGAADPRAFAPLGQRHGPMVLGVCRRVLGHAQDAEDAFQATFLVLARKAGSLRRAESLASWLYGVALRTALHARALRCRRQARERPLADPPSSAA